MKGSQLIQKDFWFYSHQRNFFLLGLILLLFHSQYDKLMLVSKFSILIQNDFFVFQYQTVLTGSESLLMRPLRVLNHSTHMKRT